ncbi:MAG TPA: glycosyltransferase family A protein [Rhodanobacteraceae bacterium]|nr:glycosyltransferase family A protein [Rhodanobacteraceae bacterium]
MSGDLVSVVMPVYDAARWLPQALDSVLAQSHANFEVVAVDDGSRDASADILARYAAADARVRVLRQANAGVAAARNAAIRAARGDYVAFLDADDRWHPDKLTRQLATLRKHAAQICYAAYWRVDEEDAVLGQVLPPPALDAQAMLCSNFIGNLTGLYARSLGDIPIRRMGHEDYAFWLEQVRRAGGAVRAESDVPLAWYRVRRQSLSGNKLKAVAWQWAILRDVAGLSWRQALPCMARYAWHAVHKRRSTSAI